MRYTSLICSLLGLILVLALGSCGTQNMGAIDASQSGLDRQSTGVSLGGFEVIRHNAEGYADSALNSTLSLKLEQQGGESALMISVDDATFTTTVAVDIKYDAERVHPVRAEFHGLLGGSSQALNAAYLQLPGKAAVGETVIGTFNPGAIKGQFATVLFANGALRGTSASGEVHQNPLGVDDVIETLANFESSEDVLAQTAGLTWYGGWARADGDQNSEVNISDITPIGAFFQQNTSANWAAVRADYDHNTEVNIADLTPIGFYFGEVTNSYIVQASDDAEGATKTAVATILWGDGDPYDTAGATSGSLFPAFSRWQLEITTSSAFNYAALQALDVNANQKVRLFVTPHADASSMDGVESFRDVTVGNPIPIPDQLQITDYDFQVTGVTGGAGTNGDLFGAAANDLSAVANSAATLQLNSISGTFNALDFSEGNLPTDMTQADYDAALAAARDNLSWSASHGGALGFRRTQDWLVPGTGTFPMTGDPGACTVFPDDDPESDAANAEGSLLTRLPADGEVTYPADDNLEIHVLSPIQHSVNADVTVDPNATILNQYTVDGTNPITELLLNVNTSLFISFDWGTATPPAEADYGNTALELWQMDPDTGLGIGAPIEFDYTTDPLTVNKYFVRLLPDPINLWEIGVMVPGLTLVQGGSYAFRFNNTFVWSSINKPAEMLTTAEPPPAQPLMVIPDRAFPVIDEIVLMYEDPIVRRNPRLILNPLTNSLEPLDAEAFADILKINGDEFAISRIDTTTYPLVGIKETDNPNDITSATDPSNIAGIIVNEANPHRVRVYVGPTTPSGGSVGDPDKTFAVKLFGPGDNAIGQATYNVAPIQIDPPPPAGIRWAVNVWDREGMEIADRVPAFDTWAVNGDTIGPGHITPDVIWVEFGGGWVYDFTEDPAQIDGTNNVKILLEDNATASQDYMAMMLRIIGLDATGNYLAVHPVATTDFVNPILPGGGPGKLNPGHDYLVQLDSPQYPGIDFAFDGPSDHDLVVTGSNPNL